MIVVTAKEMQEIDEKAIKELKIPSLVLMENAGVAAVRVLEEEFGDLSEKRIIILAGNGNNGGDGLVIARHLLNRDVNVKVYMLGTEEDLSEECRHNLSIFKKLQGEISQITDMGLSKLRINITLTDIVIDALVGTGFAGEPKGVLSEIIGLVNNCRNPVVAIDVPSGVNSTSGAVYDGNAIRAMLTISFGFMKTGLVLYPGADYCGKLKVVDIGIPKQLAVHIKRHITDKTIIELLPPRHAWAHKGTFGHCLVIAGSRSMPGAAYLTGYGLLRSGAGVVTLAVPACIKEQFPPGEVIVVPVQETETGCLGLNSIDHLLELSKGKTALVIGPGLGRDSELQVMMKTILQSWQGPLVLDADGLNSITDLSWLTKISAAIRRNWIFTPHPGEMARLLNQNTDEISKNRIEVAWSAYQQLGVNIVLKGAPTIIAGDNQIYINSTGNPGMSTAGMGDVLSGIVGALLCQGMNPFLAAVAGVYIHGQAGDHLNSEKGRGMIASDLLSILPTMFSGRISRV